jgi:hypothetical protein
MILARNRMRERESEGEEEGEGEGEVAIACKKMGYCTCKAIAVLFLGHISPLAHYGS